MPRGRRTRATREAAAPRGNSVTVDCEAHRGGSDWHGSRATQRRGSV